MTDFFNNNSRQSIMLYGLIQVKHLLVVLHCVVSLEYSVLHACIV